MAALRAALALSCALAAAQAQLIDDWLVTPPSAWPAPTFERNADASWTLSNGLVSRTFVFEPAFGTVDFFSHARGASLLRAIDVEGYIGLDGTVYPLGGIIQTGSYYHAYLNRSDTGIQVNPGGWNATGWALGPPTAPFPWTPGTRGSPADAPWPPVGLTLSVTLAAPASAPPAHRAVSVTLHYQLVVGVPLLTQWVSVNSTGAAAAGVVVTSAAPVSLRVAQPYSPLSFSPYPPSTLQRSDEKGVDDGGRHTHTQQSTPTGLLGRPTQPLCEAAHGLDKPGALRAGRFFTAAKQPNQRGF